MWIQIKFKDGSYSQRYVRINELQQLAVDKNVVKIVSLDSVKHVAENKEEFEQFIAL